MGKDVHPAAPTGSTLNWNRSHTLNHEHLFPSLVLGLPDTDALTPAIGHGLVVQLVDEHAIVTPERLREANLSVDEAHRIARENLVRFADEAPDLSIQVLGAAGEPVHFLLYSDHPRASACLLLPDLYEHACEVLNETDLLACVPQRESLVVFPKRDRAYREALVNKLKQIETDACYPLTFELFALAAGTVTPFAE